MGGFAEDEGLELRLVRTTSWATVRDRLVYGQVEAAHMLGPLAVAVTLGLSQQPARLAAPFRLGMNGNTLTLAPDLAAALDPAPLNRVTDPVATAHDFASAIGLHRRKPIIGVVHRFSSHALTLRYWLATAGVDPDRDLVLRVLPPSLMVEALRAGEIDGFMAGEPWGGLAVAEGLGQIVALGPRLWRNSVEAVRDAWAETNPDTLARAVRALDRAAAWCDDPANHEALALMLARPEHLDQPAALIQRGLTGDLALTPESATIAEPDFMVMRRDGANVPAPEHGLWIYSQFVRWGMTPADAGGAAAAAGVFRPDLYRAALGGEAATPPPMRFFDEVPFTPDDVDGYLARLRSV
jgi:NitT/TauT family transport system ATP-binding protein